MSELEDLARAFVHGTNGIDLGQIDKLVAKTLTVKSAPIRLQNGYAGPKGFGRLHIEENENRFRRIQGFGYLTVCEFCEHIAANYTAIHHGYEGRLLAVVKRKGALLVVVLNHDSIGGFWGITTAYFASQVQNLAGEVLRTDGSGTPSSDAVKRPRFETLSLPETRKPGGKGS